MAYATPKHNRRGGKLRDSTTRSRDMVVRQAAEVIRDETCPGRCDWANEDVVILPPANGHYPPEFLEQACVAEGCTFRRLVASPDHPHHADRLAQLDTRVNTVPEILTRFATGA